MPETFPSSFIPKKNVQHQKSPFLILVQIRVPTDPETLLRLTPNPEKVTFGTTTAGVPIDWDPWNLTFGGIRTDTSGSTPEILLTAGDITRDLQALLILHNWLLDQDVEITIVHEDLLGDPADAFTMEFKITHASSNTNAVTWSLSANNAYQFDGPSELLLRNFCSFTYKGPHCGFTLDPGETLGPCNKDFDTGCTVRGDFEVAAGGTRAHPNRIGAAPGIPVRP